MIEKEMYQWHKTLQHHRELPSGKGWEAIFFGPGSVARLRDNGVCGVAPRTAAFT
jgi:hypothetical protein